MADNYSEVLPKPLTGAEKVAALLLVMGPAGAGRLLKHFDPSELRLITRAAADLGSVSSASIENLIDEFYGSFSAGLDLMGNAGQAQQLMAGVLPPDQIADIMSDVLGSSNNLLWEKLSNLAEASFADYLLKEHPQTAALVLSRVAPSTAAKIVTLIPRDLRNGLMRRLLSLKPASDPAMYILESVLQEDLLHNIARKTGADANARVADIINKLERDQVEEVLQSLAEDRPKAAEILRGLLFTFDDIVKLSTRARAILFDQVPSDRIVIALKGTDTAFREVVLSALSARARRLVEAELSTTGPVQQKDVQKARRMIADLVLELAEKGTIEISDGEGGEGLV